MQDAVLIDLSEPAVSHRSVTFFIRFVFYIVQGRWQWEFHADAVFCSDVIFSHPVAFQGLKSIIHPDDRDKLAGWLENASGPIDFRVISTFGEVKNISGNHLSITTLQPEEEPEHFLLNEAIPVQASKMQLQDLQLRLEIYQHAGRFTKTGIWWYNSFTQTAWYDSEVYRIHDLPPHSLNAHPETFSGFIDPEDRDIVKEFISRSISEHLPLHIEFRIVTPLANKWVRYISQWHYDAEGASILSGSYQEITEQKNAAREIKESENRTNLTRQLLKFGEFKTNTAYWTVDLLSRKTLLSDQFYRMFGIRPPAPGSSLEMLFDFIHPADRHIFREHYHKMMEDHVAPDLEFRVLLSDARTRYISLKSKMIYQGEDKLVLGTFQDITMLKFLDKKIKGYQHREVLKNWLLSQNNLATGSATMVWDLGENEFTWSEEWAHLLGLKTNSSVISLKWLMDLIHPEDRRKFDEVLKSSAAQKKAGSLQFRMAFGGKNLYFSVSFDFLDHEGSSYLAGVFQEITAGQVLRTQLDNKVRQLSMLTDNINDRVLFTDANFKITAWNAACEQWYHLPGSQVIGKNYFDVFPEKRKGEEAGWLQRVLKGEKLTMLVAEKGYHQLQLVPVWNAEGSEVISILQIIHDVTREHELRKALNDRLSFIENLVESSVDRIIAMDRNLNYLVWNKKCEEFYGLSKEQVIGKNLLEVFPNTQNSPTYDQLRRVLKGEMIQVHPPAGIEQDFYHEISLTPVRNEQDEVIAILWILHDVTRQYKIEQDLRQLLSSIELQNKIYEHAEDIANMGTWTWNPSTGESMYSDKMFRLFGLEPGELKPGFDTIPQFIHPADRGRLLERAKALKEGQQPIGTEYRVIRKDGVERIFFNKVKLVRNERGEQIAVGTTGDITEKKKKELELNESRELLQQTTMATPDAITVYDLVNKEPIYLNNCLSEWTGYSSEELVAMGYEGRLQIIYIEDRERLVRFNEKMQDSKNDVINTIEYRINSRKGLIWIRNRSKVFSRNEAGEVTHILSVLQDFTEEVILREKLGNVVS